MLAFTVPWCGGRRPEVIPNTRPSTATVRLLAATLVTLAATVIPLNGRAGLKSGLKDCDACPEMVVLRAGEFAMGSPANEKGSFDTEYPQHRVTIGRAFALGKYEVTFDEWDACTADGGCNGYRPEDREWGRGRRPAIHVSWNDAKAYVDWLSRKTGKRYRLPSEAEWEYAARAGTTTPYHFGPTIETDQANYKAPPTEESESTGVVGEMTVAVGSFPANAFGLHDVHGNVWEWTEDCWHGNYAGAPSDGGAWTADGECGKRVLRGGSWIHYPSNLRSADRYGSIADNRNGNVGFRVARSF